MRGCRRAIFAVVVAACVLGVPAAAQAQPRRDQAMIRIAHFSPDASYVDVYMVSLNRRQLFPNVFYKAVSAYWKVAAGRFTYEVRPAGATPESEPAIRVMGRLEAGGAYTVAAVGRRDRLQGVLFRDDMSPSAPGKAKVRFLDAAPGLPPVDIALAGGRVLSSDVAFPEPTGYAQLASGAYKVEVRRSGADAVLVKGEVAVKPGTVTSVALLGGAGKPRELYAFGDATGSMAAPSGGIRTGAGGTAPSSRAPAAPVPLPALVAALGLLGAPAAPGLGRTRPALTATAASGRPGRTLLAFGMAALVLALTGCAGSDRHPVGSGALAPAPEPAPAAPAKGAAGTPDPPGPRSEVDMPRAGVDVPGVPPKAPGFEVAGVPRQLTAPGPASPPVRLAIPSIGVATPLVRLARERDGSMQVPADFARAGWFAEGPPPGAVGPAVIAGHVDSRTGPAVFFRLRELRPADTVEVERADGTRLVFVVEQARGYPRAAFPTAAVFGPAPWAALRLVTCGGDFDRARGSYRDNLVVFASLARVVR